MNDKELADAVVALGIGESDSGDEFGSLYYFEGFECEIDDKYFISNWLVVGALIEKCEERGIDWITALCNMSENAANEANESIPRAITEALTSALTTGDS